MKSSRIGLLALGALVAAAVGSAAQPAAAASVDFIGFTASVPSASCSGSLSGCGVPTINRGTNIPTSNGGTVSTFNYSFTPISLTAGSFTPLSSPLFVVEPTNTGGTTETATIIVTLDFFLPSLAAPASITIATDFTYDDQTGVDTLIWQETNEVFVTSSSCTGPSTHDSCTYDFSIGDLSAGGQNFAITMYNETDLNMAQFAALTFDPGASTSVPEPASLAILGTALVGLGALRRRWKAA